MPSKEQVLALLSQGHGYDEIAGILGIPAGQAYLVATGIPADGGDTVTAAQRERPGVLPSRTQRLVNPREVNPTGRGDVREWIRERARRDHPGPAARKQARKQPRKQPRKHAGEQAGERPGRPPAEEGS
ncbi:hypothetical protein [Microtetraspora niveoalba]|uniref:hypothetical protein n=1 Tax=Microtetraspora niveoalba TaxID=46175 RepID=UPI00082D937A|nr:hypothetical protein [Microtetraspora niveoalba]